MAEKIKIDIEANGKTAQAEFDKTTASVEKTTEAVNESSNSFVNLYNRIENLTKSGLNYFIDYAQKGLIALAVRTAAFGLELQQAFKLEKTFVDANRLFEGTQDEIQNLNNELKELATTKLGLPIEEIGYLAKLAGSMGQTADNVAGFIETSVKAALSFNMPAEQMMQSLGGIQAALNLTNDQLPTFADQVRIAADRIGGMTTEAGIMQVLANGAAQAGRMLGLAANETISLASTMLVIEGNVSNSSTALNKFLSSLTSVNAQTPDFKNSLLSLGTTSEKLSADIRNNPIQAITELLAKIKELPSEQKNTVISNLIGNDVTAKAQITGLVEQVDTLKQQLILTSDESLYAGGVVDAYAKKLETADSQIQLMQNSLKIMAAAFATPFVPIIKIAVQAITSFTDWLRKAAEQSPFLEILGKVTFSFFSLGGAIKLVSFLIIPFIASLKSTLAILNPIIAVLFSKTALLFRDVAALTANTIAQVKNTVANSAYIISLRAMIAAQLQAAGSTNLLTLALTNPIKALALLANAFKFLVGGAFGLLGIAITTAVVYFAFLADKTVEFGNKTVKVSEILKAAWESFADIYKPLFDLFSDPAPIENIENIGHSAQNTFSNIENIIISTLSAFSKLFGYIKLGVQTVVISIARLANNIAIEMNFIEDVLTGKGIKSSLDKRNKDINDSFETYIESLKQAKKEADNVDIYETITGRLNRQKTAANPSGRQSPSGTPSPSEQSQEVINAAKKQADLIAQIEKESRDKRIADLRTEESEKIRLIENSGKTQKQIDDDVFKAKLESGRKLYNELKAQLAKESADLKAHADGTKKLDNDQLTAKKATLKEIQTAYKTNIDNLNALEQQHRDKVKAINDEIKGLKKSEVDGLREIARQAMSEMQLAADKELEIEQKTAQVRQLLNQGEYQQAAELSKELNGLTLEQAKAKAAAAKETGDTYAVTQAQYEYQQSLQLTNETLNAQKAAEQEKANAAAAQAELQRAAYENVGNQIQALNETLATGAKLDVIVDSTQIDELKEKIDKEIPKEKVINIKWESDKEFTTIPIPQARGYATGGFVGGTGTGDTVPAMLTPNEYVLTVPETKMLKGMGFFKWLKSPKQKFSTGGFVKTSSLSSPTLSSGNKTTSGETFNLNLNLGNQTVAATVDKQNFDILKSLSAALEKQSRVTR